MKIDLLQFVPETISGFNVLVEQKQIGNEPWLRIWYKQNRVRPIEIRRFIDANVLGSLLGQYQAEGTKYNRLNRKLAIEFSNENIFEHKEFVTGLEELGLKRSQIKSRLVDSNERAEEERNRIAEKYEKAVGIKPNINYCPSKRSGLGFKTILRSTVLTEIFLNSMNIVRNRIIAEPKEHVVLTGSFLAKLLTGDGTLNIDRRKFPRVHLMIKDENLEYLQDYAKLLRAAGFNYVRLYPQYISVEAACSFEMLLYLYKIRAFKNTRNWDKLLVAIGLCLRGRRIRTKLRFFDLENSIFTGPQLSKLYSLHPANRKWIRNMLKNGYIERLDNKSPCRYKLTGKAQDMIQILKSWKVELEALQKLSNTTDLSELLESLKIKGKNISSK